ncbi:MAG: hypothetical protein JWP89_705 [Schlesneria sp.]|nr:hypothetical protein [Schlesneria sp.]
MALSGTRSVLIQGGSACQLGGPIGRTHATSEDRQGQCLITASLIRLFLPVDWVLEVFDGCRLPSVPIIRTMVDRPQRETAFRDHRGPFNKE